MNHAIADSPKPCECAALPSPFAAPPQSGGTGRPRIILADDFVELAELMECMLAMAGYAVTVVHNGDDAIEKLKNQPTDLAILDIDMPGTNGFEVCRFVKGQKERCKMPAILCPGRYGPDDRALAYELGVNAFLQKPFTTAELLKLVQSALSSEQRQTSPRTEANL
jgi:DNA-binding response OmpR family regulator